MIMAETMAYFLVVVGFLLSLPALWLLCRGLWPGIVETATQDCQRGLLFPFLVGIPLSVVAFFAAAIASKELGQASTFVTFAIICVFILFASLGIAGLTTSIGMKLPSPADADRPWQATIRGSVVLELAILLPILGWFLILPATIMIGSGAALRSMIANFKNRPRKVKGVPAKTETPDLGMSGTVGAA